MKIVWTEPAVNDLDNIHSYIAKDSVREIFIHPYRLIYRISNTMIEILAVIHEARDTSRTKEIL